METTLGIDLSSQPRHTAACAIEWAGGRARVTALWHGRDDDGAPLDDARLMAAMCGDDGPPAGAAAPAPGPAPAKIGIDAPLGWPVDFVAAVGDPDRWPLPLDAARARLERRATDRWVHRTTGKLPLSVSTDRIAYPAMRAAGLVAHHARLTGTPVDRSGVTGPVCETYPDPTIRRLGLWPGDLPPRASYKGAAHAVRERIVDALRASASWLTISDHDARRCVEVDDCLDALVCALAARAALRGLTTPPPPELRSEARREGWIHLPHKGALGRLA